MKWKEIINVDKLFDYDVDMGCKNMDRLMKPRKWVFWIILFHKTTWTENESNC